MLKAEGLEVIRVATPIFQHDGKTYEAVSRAMAKPQDFLIAAGDFGWKKIFLLDFFPVMGFEIDPINYVFRGKWE
jgi:hypothetical protein